jgi:acetyltransferase-like isoleucine patch superfamily enzyme
MADNNIVSEHVTIAEDVIVNKSELHEYSRLKKNVEFRESVLGAYSYVSSGCVVNKSIIGKFTSVGPGTFIGLWEHNTDVSTHSFYLYETSGQFVKGYQNYKRDHIETIVGNDVWIGANVCIQKGVTVGNGAIIGSGAIVTKDVLPYSIVVGNPAKILRYRFSEEDIEMFLHSKWWDFSRAELQEMVNNKLFENFDSFKNYIKNRKNEL